MGFVKEFREFATKGNVLDLAVGVIIGAAFGKIVSSFVSDIMMPPLGILLGKVSFADMFLVLSGGGPFRTIVEAKAAGAVTLNYGAFISNIIDFILVALCIFILIKQANKLKKSAEAPAAPETAKECPECLSKIPKAARKCAFCASQQQA